MKISKFLKDIGFSVVDVQSPELVLRGLTHSSYSKEHNLGTNENNERLEFFGDAVLKLCSSEFLFSKYPDKNEGELSNIRSYIVSDANLVTFADKINLKKYLRIGYHEEKTGGRERHSTIACAFEGLLGALYIQTDYKTVFEFLLPFFEDSIKHAETEIAKFNAKALLQEYTQGKNKDLPEYVLVAEAGKEHEKVFYVEVSYHGEKISEGSGKSKKEAEQAAAYEACRKFGVINE